MFAPENIVNRSQIRMEGITNRRAGTPKTTLGKGNVVTRLGEEIEGGRAKLT